MYLEMNLSFFVVALLFSTTAALEKNHVEKLRIVRRQLTEHFQEKRISPAYLDRERRGFDPQCYNAGLQVVQKCKYNITDYIDAYTGSKDASLTVKQVNDVLCIDDGCYNAVLNVYKKCGALQVNIYFSISCILGETYIVHHSSSFDFFVQQNISLWLS